MNDLTSTQKVFQPMDGLQARFDVAFAMLKVATQAGNLAAIDAAHAEIKAIELEQTIAARKVRDRIRAQAVRVTTAGTPNAHAVGIIMKSIEKFMVEQRTGDGVRGTEA